MEEETLLASSAPAKVEQEPIVVTNRPSRKLAAGLVGLGLLAGGVAAAFTRRPVEATATELGSLKSAYCNLTISKQTFSVSEPATTGKWLRSYFPSESASPAGGFTDYSLCEHSMGGCGSYRPAGDTDAATVGRAHFNARLGTMGEYDAFMDFATVFVANSLDSYINDFERDGVAYMLLRWKDNSGINFEIVSAVAPEAKAQRPIFEDDMRRDRGAHDEDVPAPGGAMPIRFIQRTDTSSYASTFGVKDLENAKNEAHEASYTSPSCGFDQYYDNHFDLTRYEVPVDTHTDLLTTAGNKWHCSRVGFGALDVYAVEPTGDAIQLDGYLTDAGTPTMMTYGCYNTSNVLFHLCSEGKCITKSAPVSHLEPGDDDPTKTDDLTVAATTTSSSETGA
ncbi:hypothetical protein SO694_00046168 [Aureococcus anophagefferens]|uniref:Uncharacterized protein n=1 Tax=Aureococcus anophagefferens TaxID=44056 RepID=A0ABR1G7T7_AURAN